MCFVVSADSVEPVLLCSPERTTSPPKRLSSKVALLRPEHVLGPESLPLHDVPQLAQVWLSNDVVWFELERAHVVFLCFWKFPVEVEDGTQVHQCSRVLREGRYMENRVKSLERVWCCEDYASCSNCIDLEFGQTIYTCPSQFYIRYVRLAHNLGRPARFLWWIKMRGGMEFPQGQKHRTCICQNTFHRTVAGHG